MTQDDRHHEQEPETITIGATSPLFDDEDEVIEETVENGKRIRRRGIYLLPNLFTTAALFSGFTPLSAQWTATLPTRRSPFSLPWCSMAWMVASRA